MLRSGRGVMPRPFQLFWPGLHAIRPNEEKRIYHDVTTKTTQEQVSAGFFVVPIVPLW
jgi:hypothetical protein